MHTILIAVVRVFFENREELVVICIEKVYDMRIELPAPLGEYLGAHAFL